MAKGNKDKKDEDAKNEVKRETGEAPTGDMPDSQQALECVIAELETTHAASSKTQRGPIGAEEEVTEDNWLDLLVPMVLTVLKRLLKKKTG